MTRWTYSLRSFRHRPGRTLLTLGSVVVGVAVLVATTSAVEAARRAYREMYECVAGKECLEVTAPGQAGFDGAFAGRIAASPLVRAVVPRIVATAAIVDSSGASPALVCAVDAAAEAADLGYVLCDGQPLSDDNCILLDASFAAAHGFRPGISVRLWTPGGPAELSLVGTIRPTGASAFTGAAAVRMTLAAAQRLFRLPNQINSVQLFLTEGTSAEAAEAVLAGSLPVGLSVQRPGQRGELARATLLAAEQGLYALGLLAVVAGGFIVLNTCLMSLGERRRDLSIFRALGATRRQVAGILLGESAMLGVVGAAAGLIVGLVSARLLAGAMQEFLGVTVPAPEPGRRAVLLAFVVGPGASLLPVLFATRRFHQVPPLHDLAAIRRSESTAISGPPWKFAVSLLLAGTAVVSVACSGRLPNGPASAVFAPGLAVLLAGSVLLLPRLASVLLAGLEAPMQWAFGVEGRLATLQMARRPVRTGLTAGVLFLAGAVAVGFGHSILHALDDVRRWCRQAIVADFLVRGAMPDASFLLAASLPEAMGEQLREFREVQRVDQISFVPAQVNGRPALVLARTFDPDGRLPIDLRTGDAAAVRRSLWNGEVVLGSVLAAKIAVGEGDEVSLATPNGEARLPVAGTAVEFAAGGEALYLEWETARKLLRVKGVHVYLVTARPGQTASLAESLRSYCDRNGLLLQSNQELRRLIEDDLGGILGALWTLLVVLLLVASLGVANTLTMNVLEQTREIGILRAVGMTRGRIRKLVLGQAGLLALTGLVPGLVVGLGLAALLEHAPTSFAGRPDGFHAEPFMLFACAGLGSLVVLVASYLPARRAARMQIMPSLAPMSGRANNLTGT